jgi:hypothetical protein
MWFVGEVRGPQAVVVAEDAAVIIVSEGEDGEGVLHRLAVFDADTGALLRHILGDMRWVRGLGYWLPRGGCMLWLLPEWGNLG